MLRIGVIGYGYWGPNIVRNFSNANGSQVVWNYSGSLLKKVTNGTAGLAPQPDDVLSYGATSTTGHTSVVAASNVNASGNGSITVIEENAAASGSASLTVTNWTVNGDAGAVSGWLTSNKPPQTLSVSKSGTGGGTITSDLTGINCGLTCSYAFPYNQAVTLTAAANSSSIFTGWSGAGCSGTGTCTVTMSTALSVSANFTLASFHNYLQLVPRYLFGFAPPFLPVVPPEFQVDSSIIFVYSSPHATPPNLPALPQRTLARNHRGRFRENLPVSRILSRNCL